MTTMFPYARPRRWAANSAYELRLTAVHEARHAICAHALGVSVSLVTIIPDAATRTLGHVKRGSTTAIEEATIIAAALIGESKRYKRDAPESKRFAQFTQRNQVAGRANAVAIDVDNEGAIAKLAEILQREKTLSGSRLQTVLGGLLVRPYLSPTKRRIMSASPVKAAAPTEPDRRYTPAGSVRATADGERISGLAAVYYDGTPGTEFELWPGMVERILPGAFDGVLGDDVRGLFNHDANQVLGRTSAGTMKLSTDAVGLRYEIEPGKTTVAVDVLEHIRRGDVQGSSFSFTMEGDGEAVFREIGDDVTVREIVKIGRLFDVGPVTFPAYEATTTGLRSRHVREALAAYRRWKG